MSKYLHLVELEQGSPNIYWPSTVSAELQQGLSNVFYSYYKCFRMSNLTTTVVSEYLLDSYCHSGARTGVAKRVLAFDSLCEARTGVAKRVLAFNSLCGGRTGVAKHIIAFNSLCSAQMRVREHLHVLAFNSLWTSLVIVSSNTCCMNCVIIDLIFEQFQ